MNRADACFQLAQEAAGMLASFKNRIHPSLKGPGTPVTEADHASERFLLDEVSQRFPEDGFLGEEGSFRESRSGYLWLADPLDGTRNFVHGLRYFAVSLAVVREGEPIAGAVCHGAVDEIFCAERGAGARRNGRAIGVSATANLEGALLGTGFPKDPGTRQGPSLRRLEALFKANVHIRVSGCAALDLCNVAAGNLDLFLGEGATPWDLAAGLLIVTEAGGRVSDWNGRPLDLQAPEHLVASNALLHEGALEITRRLC